MTRRPRSARGRWEWRDDGSDAAWGAGGADQHVAGGGAEAAGDPGEAGGPRELLPSPRRERGRLLRVLLRVGARSGRGPEIRSHVRHRGRQGRGGPEEHGLSRRRHGGLYGRSPRPGRGRLRLPEPERQPVLRLRNVVPGIIRGGETREGPRRLQTDGGLPASPERRILVPRRIAQAGRRFYPPGLWEGPADRRWVALTFDDGPHPDLTLRALDALRKT